MHPFRIACYELGWTESYAADRLGITPSWLSHILNDDPKANPSLELYEQMVALAAGKVTLEDLKAHRAPGQKPRRRREPPGEEAAA